MSTTMTIWVHRAAKRYTDYGSHLDTVTGLSWSVDGDPATAFGFEQGDFDSLLAKKRAAMAAHTDAGIELRIGPDVHRSCDMNPHGLM